jgi:UDPglucose 6-dehydrogenase
MDASPQTLTVVGLGKLGAPMAACFASKGFQVIGVDLDEDKLAAISAGRATVFEPGLDELVSLNRQRLSATADLAAAVAGSDATFLVVATPSEGEGGFSLRYVLPACEQIGGALAGKDAFHLVVLTSTVMPGSTAAEVVPAIERASGKRCGEDFGVCYSPEFIALGSVIRDFLNPDFLLVGESDPRAGDMLEGIYARVVANGATVARMNFVNAELAKLAVNTFVTTKIAFANTLARMCERMPGANVDEVTSALGLDTRIGSKYLRGAISFGGPCFPRDNAAFAAVAREIGAPAFVAEATDALNRDGITRLADLVREQLPAEGTVSVLGLSYKPQTDVIEESAGLLVAQTLAEQGAKVVVYDPAALANATRALGTQVAYAGSAEEAIQAADVIVLATAWPQFKTLQPSVFERNGEPRTVVDCWRLLDRRLLDGTAEYVALGEGAPAAEATVRD